MESLYFDKDTPVTVIRQFASDRYGEYGGYAQQYLFYFGKINEIGKNRENNRKIEKNRENTRKTPYNKLPENLHTCDKMTNI